MHTKSQLSIFLILIFVMLIAFILLFAFNISSPSTNLFGDNSIPNSVKIYVEQCLILTAKTGVDLISTQGGYYIVQGNSIDIGGFSIPFYASNTFETNVPTADDVKDQLDLYILAKINLCIDNFSPFVDMGIEVNQEDTPTVTSSLKTDSITVFFNMPLKIQIEDRSITRSEFKIDFIHELLQLYTISLDALNIVNNDMEIIPVSLLSDLGSSKDVFVSINDYRNGDVIYSIVKNKDTDDEIYYDFAVNYYSSFSDTGIFKSNPDAEDTDTIVTR